MKKILPLIFLIFLFGCKETDYFDAPGELKKSDYTKDWIIFREIIEKLHPALDAYHKNSDVINFLDSQSAKINDKTDFSQFYAILSESIDFIGDGHTSVIQPDWFWNSINEWFPFDFFPLKDSIYVGETEDIIPKGSIITEIDGKKANEILNELKIYSTGDGFPKPYETDLLNYYFSDFYTAHYGSKSSYQISWIEPGEKIEKKQTFSPWKYPDIEEYDTDENIEEEYIYNDYIFEIPSFYEFSQINKNTAYLIINSFDFSEEEGSEETEKDYYMFLDQTFKELSNNDTNELILDLRENEGGYTDLVAELLSYLINEEFIIEQSTYAKTQKVPLKQYILPSHKSDANSIELELKTSTKKNKNGYYVYDDYYYSETVIPKLDLLFKGKLKVLVSYTTFSAAAMCAALLEDRTDALTIGQETSGGYYRLCNSPDFDYRLPSTGIVLSIPTDAVITNIKNNKFPKGSGVVPDIIIDDRIGSILREQDPELEAALLN